MVTHSTMWWLLWAWCHYSSASAILLHHIPHPSTHTHPPTHTHTHTHTHTTLHRGSWSVGRDTREHWAISIDSPAMMMSWKIPWRYASPHITWCHMTSQDITWCHMTSQDITWCHMMSHDFTRYHMTSHGITWHHMISHDITHDTSCSCTHCSNMCAVSPQEQNLDLRSMLNIIEAFPMLKLWLVSRHPPHEYNLCTLPHIPAIPLHVQTETQQIYKLILLQ